MLLAILIAVVLASAVTAVVAPHLENSAVRDRFRIAFLVVANLHPMNWGTWRKEFSKREALFACWFLVFGITLAIGVVASGA